MGAVAGDELVQWEKAEEDGSGVPLCGGITANGCSSGSGSGIASGGGSGAGGVVGGGGGGGKEEGIRVSVRLRPLNARELARNDPLDWECINDTTIIFRNSLPERSVFPTAYTFDRVFQCDSTTKQVYEEGAKEVALSVVSGINASIFAYGQTSSGKTYTMTGITEYAMTDIYEYVDRHNERAFVLKFSAIEIYNEAVRDLLSPDSTPLRLLDDPDRGTTVEKLTEETLRDLDHMKELLSVCEAQRQIGETSLNETSSRSHQILRLTIESSAREFLGKENSSALAASVNFVDLAGSERASQALSAGTRLKEGCHINRSLLTLGTVIRKLSKGRNGHIPYRDSKLTRILQPSLGGNARTAIICTLSPARSHTEQSRNTLLFASCAKEVFTSAQVNVVMSDKALVKHLQKELARLESELRCPGSTSSNSKSHAEALLKEKDAKIQKMEKEIKELVQQRDLAQSRLEDLLRAVGDDQESQQWDELIRPSTSHVPSACEDELSTYDSSDILDFGFLKSTASQEYACDSGDSANYRKSFLELLQNSIVPGAASPQISVSNVSSIGMVPHESGDIANYSKSYLEILGNSNEHDAASLQNSVSSASPHEGGETISQDECLDMDGLCMEVQCIEIDGMSPRRSEQSNSVLTEGNNSLSPLPLCENNHGNRDSMTKAEVDKDTESVNFLEHFAKPCPDDSSTWPSNEAVPSSRHLSLTKSRSCRASLMDNSLSSLFLEEEQNRNTPPSNFLKDFPGRPEKSQRRLFPLNDGAEVEASSEDGSRTSERTSFDVLKGGKQEEDVTNVCNSVAELKMGHTQSQEQLNDGQVQIVVGQEASEDTNTKSVKDIGVDPMIHSIKSPSTWQGEFERQQREIIELWHACNVSLVHRTYFFLLFKGDPADSIYMEVELRRLHFLKRIFTQGIVGKPMLESSCTDTLASSMRALQRERGMLCRQMQKRLSAQERESLYCKWGIPLHSKQRKLQLTRLIWSESRNMDHIRESASVVAAIIGLLEPDQALKEMFGLSFTPQRISCRSQSWKDGMSSLA